jgi:DNA polymerase-3 subunit beta
LGVASDNPDLGEAREDLDVEYAGAPLMVGFNARFFMDVLSEMEQAEVVLELNGDLDPAVLHPPPSNSGSYVAVIMPMRI